MRHRWISESIGAHYANFYKCEYCGATRIYSWMPGWPGSNAYYDPSGKEVPRETECESIGPLFEKEVSK